MKKNFTFTALILACTFLGSCTSTGIIVAVGAIAPVIYEETRINKPDLKLTPLSVVLNNHNIGENVKVPDIKFPSLNLFPKNKPQKREPKKITSLDLNAFGFDCSKAKKKGNNTECFNEFSDSSNKKINKLKTSKTNFTQTPASINVPTITSAYLNKWVKAWESQDIDKYLSLYSINFKGNENNHKDWKLSRERAFTGKNKHISINLRSIKTQANKNVIEINFIQDYSSNKHSDTGIKELILLKNKDDWKIVKETWVQGKKINSNIKPTKFINGELSGWLKAWAKQDVNSYLSFYSDQFKDTKHDLAKWQSSRKRALEANNNLSIEASNVQISESLNRIKLNFTQQFKSDKYSDVGEKELVWIKNGDSWKILKESWVNS